MSATARLMALLLVMLALAAPAAAEGERAGEYDYYVLALSWSPAWCAAEGDARGAPECAAGAARGWSLHGLWPQYERGWPSWCASGARDPSRRETAAMADLMGSSGLAWHQWKKHGRCTGLPAADYFELSRRAFAGIARPAILRRAEAPLRLAPDVVKAAFREANPALPPGAIAITCSEGRIAEARICLTRDLEPRRCGADVGRGCAGTAVLEPLR